MWEAQRRHFGTGFFGTQILREIKVGKSGAQIANLIHLEALNLDLYDFLHFVKTENDQKIKIQRLQNCKLMSFLELLGS